MAHLQSFKMHDVKRLVNEYERNEKYVCTDNRIHKNKTFQNYKMDEVRDFEMRFRDRFNSVNHSKRKDLNVLSTWVITCPQELKDDKIKRERFFSIVYDFTKQRYGSENVLQGYVHLDETTPHIHIALIPFTGESVSSKNLFTRKELQSYQRDLDVIMEQQFGMKNLVLNGRTKGNFSVQELKERTKQEYRLQAQKDDLKQQGKDLLVRKQNVRKSENRVSEMIRELEERNIELNRKREEMERDMVSRIIELEKRNEELEKREKMILEREEKLLKKEKTCARLIELGRKATIELTEEQKEVRQRRVSMLESKFGF